MGMNIKCPRCHHPIDFGEVQAENDLTAVFNLIEALGSNAKLALAYIELFQVTPRQAKLKKIRLLLGEVKGLIDAGEFAFQKKKFKISPAGIAEALNLMAHRNFETALTNHNYLKSVMASISERESKGASVQAERDLREKETRLRQDERDPNGAQKVGDIMRKVFGDKV